MSRRRGLGRGLDALLGSEPAPSPQAPPGEPAEPQPLVPPTVLPIDRLEPNRFQPRSHFDPAGLDDLTESIRAQGVVQPLVVTPRRDEPGKPGGQEGQAGEEIYTIIAGERRWRAARQAGLTEVPVVVREVESDQKLLELALVENVQRSDLDPIEEAEAYRTLSETFELSQDQISKRVGKSRPTVTNTLRLLRLPREIQDFLRDGRLTAGQARPLIAMTDKARQLELAERAVAEGLTARELEKLAGASAEDEPAKKTKKAPDVDVHTRAAMEKLTQDLQTRVDIVRKKKGGGQVRIHFHTEEELIRLYDRLRKGDD